MKIKTTLIYVALIGVASAAQAAAQDLAEGEITQQLLVCDDVIDLTERLTCFNAVVDKLKSAPVAPAVNNPSESVSVPEATVVASAAKENLKSAPVVPVVKSLPESVSVSEAPVVVPTAAPEIDDFGSEGIASRSTAEEKSSAVEKIEATIVRSWKNHDGRFSVELDNGQIWRETQGTRSRLPKVDTSVIISTGRWGGYRMKVENIKKLAWVRRTK